MEYQDMLTRLGIGSAHPGGYNATLSCLELLKDLTPQNILEVGCGTGRTATTLAKKGHIVTALDIREGMIDKAKRRSALEGVNVTWVVGDACNLPFANDKFDLILIESTTIFIDHSKAISEYYRVLKNGGIIYDREMMAKENMTDQSRLKIKNLYGVNYIPSAEQWSSIFGVAKFRDVSIDQLTNISDELSKKAMEPIDQYQFIDYDLFQDPMFLQLSHKNSELMFETAPFLAHGVIRGTK